LNPKIAKIEKDIVRTRNQLAQGQARLRELERKKTELEDTEIVAAFRTSGIPPANLAAWLRGYGDGSVLPINEPLAAPAGTAGNPHTTTEEDSDIEG